MLDLVLLFLKLNSVYLQDVVDPSSDDSTQDSANGKHVPGIDDTTTSFTEDSLGGRGDDTNDSVPTSDGGGGGGGVNADDGDNDNATSFPATMEKSQDENNTSSPAAPLKRPLDPADELESSEPLSNESVAKKIKPNADGESLTDEK